ncbi:Uncharacterised protein [Flavonifractor plautii]|uniref:Uncharacterized protein n=1 Tax=Flavonifractor plautii TaxID=292800 RepID=A0A174VJ68_FLAPL|nr:Uncharacterised protein [Flavonifractor plautii]
MARPPRRLRVAARFLFTLPQSTCCTTSMVSASVQRRPSTKRDSLPSFFNMAEISGPPPWTTTTWMPTRLRRMTSPMTASRSSREIMALPPYLMTMVFP